MDEQESEYLRQHIHELERSRGRWRAVSLVSLIALALFLVAGGLATVGLGMVTMEREREETLRAREAEMEARMQAERARQAEMVARQQAEKAKGVVGKEMKPGQGTGKTEHNEE